MATIDLKGVGKTYAGAVRAVENIDLSIGDGELVVLVGPSGCGKSTLLRMIAGLETTTTGTISIDSRVVNKEEPAQRDIAMVFQNYALYPHMSVRQNLEYGLKNRGTPKDQIAARVAEAARILEIEPFLERRPRALSGGQRQRVAMGRAIVRQPKAFLFDEPLSNLDAKLRGQMRVEIRTLQRRLKTTSVYVTHDQLEAMTLADRLVVMNAGHIEQVGTPTELYAHPATLFVAGFIGSPPMNLIARANLTPQDATRLDQHAPGATTIGIRPDDLSLSDPGSSLALPATVDLIEPVGAESHVHLRWRDRRLVAQMRGPLSITDGATATFYAPLSAIHYFDANGRRLTSTA
jgi:sn-glycerol 3-phosphate transport system ATP-binding protein